MRLWLSLVVDEDDLDPIETLPNLDYKIVCGNSLIGMPENTFRDLEVEKELEALKEQFYNQTNETKKKALRTQINSKIRELLDSAESFAGYKIDFDFKLYFSEVWHEKGGFDVVIGNPPYLNLTKNNFDNAQLK
ncbi:class I SAM-dependent DNA methyltransferase, partial [bacterium]|nr:class I SAM-dependent DNA methyltransferase [bacterium]